MSDTEGEASPVSFQKALDDFLKEHGKSLDDLQSSKPKLATPKESAPVRVITTSSSHRRRLRLFSGKTPIPSGELDYENWKRPARQLVDDCSLSGWEVERLSRIVESLLSPASNIVWALGTKVRQRGAWRALSRHMASQRMGTNYIYALVSVSRGTGSLPLTTCFGCRKVSRASWTGVELTPNVPTIFVQWYIAPEARWECVPTPGMPNSFSNKWLPDASPAHLLLRETTAATSRGTTGGQQINRMSQTSCEGSNWTWECWLPRSWGWPRPRAATWSRW